MTQFVLVDKRYLRIIRIFIFRRKTGNPSHCIIRTSWVSRRIGTLMMGTVALTAELIDFKNLKRLLTQENFQNYMVLKRV
jgi:hypothetical protein